MWTHFTHFSQKINALTNGPDSYCDSPTPSIRYWRVHGLYLKWYHPKWHIWSRDLILIHVVSSHVTHLMTCQVTYIDRAYEHFFLTGSHPITFTCDVSVSCPFRVCFLVVGNPPPCSLEDQFHRCYRGGGATSQNVPAHENWCWDRTFWDILGRFGTFWDVLGQIGTFWDRYFLGWFIRVY